MTSPTTSDNLCSTSCAPKSRFSARGLTILACSIGVMMSGAGCSEDETPRSSASNAGSAAPVQREAPPPIWTLNDLELNESVQFPEQFTPRSREVADAVASFASAFASGNNVTLQGMLGQRDRAVLREMVDHGEWDRYTQSVAGVRISVLEEQGDGFRLGLGVMSNQVAYLTGWEASAASGSWTFSGLNIERIEANRLVLLDGASLELAAVDQSNTVADLLPEIPEAEEPDDDGAAPAGGGFGTGGGGGLPTRPSDF